LGNKIYEREEEPSPSAGSNVTDLSSYFTVDEYPTAMERVYRRLWEVLTGVDQSKPFQHLSADDRRAILEILRETKPGLPGYWGS
jgi:hypothetical protein